MQKSICKVLTTPNVRLKHTIQKQLDQQNTYRTKSTMKSYHLHKQTHYTASFSVFLIVSNMNMSTCTHTDTYTYTHAHTTIQMHTYMHAHTHTHAHTNTHTHTHTHKTIHTQRQGIQSPGGKRWVLMAYLNNAMEDEY